jgi:hypothetical protein
MADRSHSIHSNLCRHCGSAPATIVDPSANLRPGQILDRCTLCDAVILTLSAANGEESPHFRSSDIGYIRCETALSSSHEAAERKWTGKQIRPSRGSAWEWKERGPPVTASDLTARNMAARERETSTGCPKWNRKREALERLAVPILVFFFYRPHWLSRYDSIVGLASMGTMVSRIASGCAICSPSAVGEILVR